MHTTIIGILSIVGAYGVIVAYTLPLLLALVGG